MNITQITVSIHEKRNHSHEYGHYDAEVRYTADVTPDDDILKRTKELQYLAGSFVAAKCHEWIKGIDLERQIEESRQSFRSRLHHAVYCDSEAEMERRLVDLSAWAEEQRGKVSIPIVGEMLEQIAPARRKWHEVNSKRRGKSQQEDGATEDEIEINEYDLPL